jgi:hypothetical protein
MFGGDIRRRLREGLGEVFEKHLDKCLRCLRRF